MEPNTASRLRERKQNRLKDYMAVAGQLGVTHFMLVSQTEVSTNMRLARFPQGPTLHFNISSYMLAQDVKQSAHATSQTTSSNDFLTAPLVVLNNMDVDSSHGKLLCAMLQGMFPAINTSKVRLDHIRRVVLFDYDQEMGLIEMRHFSISMKCTGISKTVKRLVNSKKSIPDLGNLADIGDILTHEAAISESDIEPDSVVTLCQKYRDSSNFKPSQKAIALIEIGPRISLRLVKIVDGFCEGTTIYHSSK